MMPQYPALLKQVRQNGTKIDSRFGATIEVLGGCTVFQAGELVARQGFNSSLALMELTLLLAGMHSPAALKAVAPKSDLAKFTEAMAYGPRILPYLGRVVRALRTDHLTRQAVLYVGRPDEVTTNDLPCTSTIQFLRRDNLLYGVVTMRSWDLLLGLPYDLAMFGGLSLVVAHCLGLEPGPIQVTAGTMHMYAANMGMIPSAAPSGKRLALKPDTIASVAGISLAAMQAVNAILERAKAGEVGSSLWRQGNQLFDFVPVLPTPSANYSATIEPTSHLVNPD